MNTYEQIYNVASNRDSTFEDLVAIFKKLDCVDFEKNHPSKLFVMAIDCWQINQLRSLEYSTAQKFNNVLYDNLYGDRNK